MEDLSWIDNLSEEEAGALIKYKKSGIDNLSEDEAGLLLPHIDKIKPKSLVDQIPGLAPEVKAAPEPTQSPLDKITSTLAGMGEAGLHLATGATTGMLGGALSGAKGIADTVSEGTFGTQEGARKAEEAFAKGMEAGTFMPKGEKGKQYVEEYVGPALNAALPLMGMPNQLSALASFAKPVKQQLFGQKELPVERPEVTTDFRKQAAEEFAKQEQVKQPAGQMELDLGQPTKFGQRPSDFVLDENGIPIRREASIEAQTTERGGDLFESLPKEEKVVEAEPLAGHKTTELGDVIVNESAKEPGKYQVTFFDGKAEKGAIPVQDTLYNTREEAIKAFEDAGEGQVHTQSWEAPKELKAGETAFGKSQRGAVNPGEILDSIEELYKKLKPKSVEDFLVNVRDNNIQAPDSVVRTMFEGLKREQQATSVVEKQSTLSSFAKKVSPEFDQFLSVWKDKTPQEAIETITAFPDSPKAHLGLYHENLGMRGRLGAQKVQNEGVRAGLSYMAQVFENSKLEGSRLLSGGRENFNTLTRKLETVFGHGDAAEVFKQIQEAQLDPNFQFKLKPTQQKLLGEIKRVTDSTWDMIINQVSKLNPEKAAKLSRMKQEYYLPHSWSGDFVSYVRDADGKLVSFIAERTMNGAKEAANYLRNQLGAEYKIDDPVYVGNKQKQLGKKSLYGREGSKLQESFAGQFDMLIDLLGSDDAATQKAMQAVQSVMNRRAMASEGVKQHMKVNTNVEGFLGSKGWKSSRDNYFDMKRAFQSYVESAYEWKGNMEAADFLSSLKDQAPDKVNTYSLLRDQFMQNVGQFKEVSPTIQSLQRTFAETGYSPKELQMVARRMSNFVTMQQVGFMNVIQMMQNLFQSPMTQMWNYGNLVAHGGKLNPVVAAKNMMVSMWDGVTEGKSHPEWAKYARDNEINKIGLVEYPERTKGAAGIKDAVSWNIKVSEGTSRLGFFYATTKDLIAAGYPEKTALEMAKNMTRDMMGNMEKHAKPGIVSNMGIGGELLGRLQSYMTLSFELFTQSMLDAARGIKKGNPKLLIPLAGYLYAQYMTGGLNGTLPMDVAEKSHWLGVKAGLIPPEWRSPRQYMLEENPKAAISPLSRTLPIWVEGSFRNNLPFVGAPVVDMAVKKAPAIKDGMEWLFSLVYSEKEPSALEKANVLQAILPASARGAVEQNYLKTKSGTIVTPSGRPSHKETPADDKFAFGAAKYTNLRSPERGFEAEVSNLANDREFRVSQARKSLEEDFNKKMMNLQLGQKLDKEYVAKTIKRDFELGGTPEAMIGRAMKFVEQANYPNSLIVQIIRGEKDPYKQKRLISAYNRLKEGM